ncbi:T9SS type A sorting domain-containing protein [Rubricoccus marinus]|uniref:Secretion system C-terminal sorting domain-containing protein n=1 Tax=Rubricoccus marinus TaxID=716817 RepID=A0A259TUK7_9BACT|nr:T9SS type A sorting domain-containing protein [Rubricoccus marinus]OZC01445.1 hypothetical protein BSZ36_17360 [Rubricoccus marinus]
MATLRRLETLAGGDREFIAIYDDELSPFKAFKSTAAVARALDLYWALENGYIWANANGYSSLDYPVSMLLTRSETEKWADEIQSGVQHMWGGTLKDGGFIADINNHEVQAGNWPLLGFMGAAYGVLGLKDGACLFHSDETNNRLTGPSDSTTVSSKSSTYPGPENLSGCEEVLDVAIRHASRSYGTYYDYLGSKKKRMYYWAFQTAEGERLWAEGAYYFEYMLTTVLPYWHAMRAAGALNRVAPDYDPTDPFTDPRVLNPLRWHADLVTPDARTVPLDDGNRLLMLSSSLLRWAPEYGTADIGQRYAWIHDATTQQDGNAADWLHVQEIAIPRLQRPTNGATPGRVAPPTSIANQAGDEQQVVLRYSSLDTNGQPTNACQTPMLDGTRTGECHFLLLNGEHGANKEENLVGIHEATSSGEGHEQADPLQLLYSIDDHHYLDDTGYTSAPGWGGLDDRYSNGEWSWYYDHSVMWVGECDSNGSCNIHLPNGGVQPPWQNESNTKKNSTQRGVFRLSPSSGGATTGAQLSDEGPVVALGGTVALQHEPDCFVGSGTHSCTFDKMTADVRRTTLFVKGANPYLIDINRGVVPPTGNYDRSERLRFYASYFIGTDQEHPAGGLGPGNNGYANLTRFDQIASDPERSLELYVSNLETSVDYVDDSAPPPARALRLARFMHYFGALPSGDAGDPGLNFPNVTANPERTGKPVPLLTETYMKSLPERIGTDHETFVAFLAPCELSQTCAGARPAHTAPSPGATLSSQYYARPTSGVLGEEYLDVVVVRSARVYAQPSTRASVQHAIPEAGGHVVTLPSGNDEGFVRFRKYGSYYATDPGSIYNLTVDPDAFLTPHHDAYLFGGSYSNDVFAGGTYLEEETTLTVPQGGIVRVVDDFSTGVLGTVRVYGTLIVEPGAVLDGVRLDIKSGGRVELLAGAELRPGSSGTTTVNSGGTLESYGSASEPVQIFGTGSVSGPALTVWSGGTVKLRHTVAQSLVGLRVYGGILKGEHLAVRGSAQSGITVINGGEVYLQNAEVSGSLGVGSSLGHGINVSEGDLIGGWNGTDVYTNAGFLPRPSTTAPSALKITGNPGFGIRADFGSWANVGCQNCSPPPRNCGGGGTIPDDPPGAFTKGPTLPPGPLYGGRNSVHGNGLGAFEIRNEFGAVAESSWWGQYPSNATHFVEATGMCNGIGHHPELTTEPATGSGHLLGADETASAGAKREGAERVLEASTRFNPAEVLAKTAAAAARSSSVEPHERQREAMYESGVSSGSGRASGVSNPNPADSLMAALAREYALAARAMRREDGPQVTARALLVVAQTPTHPLRRLAGAFRVRDLAASGDSETAVREGRRLLNQSPSGTGWWDDMRRETAWALLGAYLTNGDETSTADMEHARSIVRLLKQLGDTVALAGELDLLVGEPDTPGSDDAPVAKSEQTLKATLSVAPNPSRGAVEIRLSVAETAPVRVSVVDLLGREIAVLTDGEQSPGAVRLRFDASSYGLAPGIYVARAAVGKALVVQRFTVLR